MDEKYWVGNLRNLGPIVYDPEIQDDESDVLILFNCGAKRIEHFKRISTKGKIKKIAKADERKKHIKLYEAYRERTTADASGEKIGINLEVADASKGASDEPVRDEALEAIQRIVETREAEIGQLIVERDGLLESNRKNSKELADALASVRKLKSGEGSISSINMLSKLVKEAAFYAAGGNEAFKNHVLELDLDAQLPIRVAAYIDAILRNELDNIEPYFSLFDLINEAQNTGLLDDAGIDMCHIIRKQRNIVAHNESTSQEMTARIMIVLFAASILWPQLTHT